MTAEGPLELRVLSGPQAGARIALATDACVDVGSLDAEGCQVALRDPRVVAQRVRLDLRGGQLRLDVLAGEIQFNGRPLVAPASANWPLYVPVRLGDTVLAVGAPHGGRWDDALALSLAPPAALEEPVRGPADLAPQPPFRRRRMDTWFALAGAALVLVATGLMALARLATPPAVAGDPAAQRLDRLLQAPAFRGLRVAAIDGQPLRITGDLMTQADRRRLETDLAGIDLAPVLDVRVGDQVTAAVREVFRMNGVVAEAPPPAALAEVGKVRVLTRAADIERLARAEASARRDVPGLADLVVENQRPAVVDDRPVQDDPGKRVASIVPGEAPYVVTADGTRYFVGALLPSGHRLASISEQEVLLDRDGVVSALRF